jgi:hypothetical protein
MAQWQCGQREAAMELYRKAVGEMETNFNARDVEERTARAEAAALLGIKEPQPRKPKEESPNTE